MYNPLDKLGAAEAKLAGYKIEHIDGERVWTLDGEKHRHDGPAVEGFFGYVEYWLNGTRVSKEYFDKTIK